jgi:hypothetical protein
MIKPSRSFQDPSNNHIVQAVKTLSSIRRLISSLVCRSLLRACQIRVPGSTVKEKLTWASHGKSPARPACPQATPTGSGEISKTCHANHKTNDTNDTNGTWHIMEQSEQSQTIGKGLHVTPWRKAPHHHHCLHHLSSAENITKHWNNWNSLTEYHRSERLELQREAFFVNLIPFTRQRKSMLLNWLNCQCSLVLRKLFLSSWALVSLLLGSSNSNNLSELLGGSALRNGAGVEDCTPHLRLTLRGGIDSYAHMLIYCRPEIVQFPSHFNRWSWYISGTQDLSRSNTADFVLFESTNRAQVAKWWASAHDATMLPGIPGTSSYSQVDRNRCQIIQIHV